MRAILSLLVLGGLVFAGAGAAQQVPVKEVVLDNGMKVLLVQRKDSPNVAAGWVAKVGSVNEHSGITGIAHLFEHMMFKGTTHIGTRNIEEDLKINTELDQLRAKIRKEEQVLTQKVRVGLIEDANDPKNRTPEHQKLLAEFDKLQKRQKELLVNNEFDRIYTSAGAAGMNAGTSDDYTIYFISVPANKLELWFWMESDRLANPVFREFYSERDVVHEERRLRVDSTPTGKQEEQFNAMFWKSSPYHWETIGWPSDLEKISREDANNFFGKYYAPNNLTAALVGNFDEAEAVALAKKYFGRLKHGLVEPEPVRTVEEAHYGEQRMTSYAETTPQVTIRYHTVADGHVDEPALLVLSALLNDRTGRLYKSLVLDQQVANAASAASNGLKYEGYFELEGVAKPGKTPEEVEQAIYREIDKLKSEPVPAKELQKVKNQLAASDFRRLQSDFALMMQLLVADANRGWNTLNTDPARLQAVTVEDIQRVAKKYFVPESKSVLLLYTKKDSEGGSKKEERPTGGVQ